MAAKVKVKVYANEDDALVFWSVDGPIAGCRGFAIERKKTDAKGKKTQEFLVSRVGFANQKAPAQQKAGQDAVTKPSTEWPFQRFSWADHSADTGDTVSYQVTPVVRDGSGQLTLLKSNASDWTPPKTLSAGDGAYQAHFNRGFMISQFMARYLKEKNLTPKDFKNNISDADEKAIREFLSGDLRTALLAQLAIAKSDKTDIYAALFELSDPELIQALCGIGGKAHLVLGNGSVKHKGDDENTAGRKELEAAGVDVQEDNRFIAPGALAHNKFLVRMDKKGKPAAVLTGSTNWTPTGLCTQLNNGLICTDPEIAQCYYEQWGRLRAAASGFPPDLVAANSCEHCCGDDTPGKVRSATWFSRTNKQVDLDALRAEVAKAKQGILFLMFMPGATGVFADVSKLSTQPNLYVRGVVSSLPHGAAPGDESAADVGLVGSQNHIQQHYDIVQPEGVAHPMAYFAGEVTRQQFLSQIGYAIVHSKVLVIDPFSDDPTVITGSHNFSASASAKNDENFIIIKGEPELAEAYAVNVIAAYDHYRWRAHLSTAPKPFNGLQDNDAWMAPMLANNRRDLQFWGVQ